MQVVCEATQCPDTRVSGMKGLIRHGTFVGKLALASAGSCQLLHGVNAVLLNGSKYSKWVLDSKLEVVNAQAATCVLLAKTFVVME